MEKFYHGTTKLFEKFDLDHAFEGDGKTKFGLGINITQVYKTAGNYSYNKKRPECTEHYVYTLEVPDLTPDNHIFSRHDFSVAESIVKKTEHKLGEKIPDEAKADGIFFRKYVGNRAAGNDFTLKKLLDYHDAETERQANKLFESIGIIYYVWPNAQTNPDGPTNRAVINPKYIRIIKIDRIELDKKNKYIKGSEREVAL